MRGDASLFGTIQRILRSICGFIFGYPRNQSRNPYPQPIPDRNNTQLPNGGNNRPPLNSGTDDTNPPQVPEEQEDQEQNTRQINRRGRNNRLSNVKSPNVRLTNRVRQVKKGSRQNPASKISRSAKRLMKPTFQRIQSKLPENHTAVARFNNGG